MTTHRVETDGTPGGYTAYCLDCPWTTTHAVLSDAWRACNQHLDDHTEASDG